MQPSRSSVDPAVVVEVAPSYIGRGRLKERLPAGEQRTLEYRGEIGHAKDLREPNRCSSSAIGKTVEVGDVYQLDDPDDHRLAPYRALNDVELRRLTEPRDGVFIVEGPVAVDRLMTSSYHALSVLVTPKKLDRLSPSVTQSPTPVLVVALDLMATIVGFDLHRGVLAAGRRPPSRSPSEVLNHAHTAAFLEGINDLENLGTIARSARALGVDALVLDPTCADPLYRRCIRVSMGEILHLPIARSTDWAVTLAEAAASGWQVLALTPSPDAIDIRDVRRQPGNRLALLLGAEGPGLTPLSLAAAHERVRIPLAEGADSINVGHAAAIAFHRLAPRPK